MHDKSGSEKELARVLKGVQRVPTLLLNNPAVSLDEMQLQRSSILDCEPLHDIKGHLANVFTEIRHGKAQWWRLQTCSD